VQVARGSAALAQGRHADAFDHFQRLFEPGDPHYHPVHRCWAIGDLAEAAAHSGHRDQALAVLRELEPLALETPSTVAIRSA
jgi:hypothetical protein